MVFHKSDFKSLCRMPVFVIQVILVLLMFVAILMCSINNQWPRYTEKYKWLFFVNLGTAHSIFIMELAATLNWVVTENSNWVHYLSKYITHGAVLLACGAIFFYDSVQTNNQKILWPYKSDCENGVDDSNKSVTTQEKVNEGFWLGIASSHICLSFYIMIVRYKFAELH